MYNSKLFGYEVKFSPEDADLLDKWTRADDCQKVRDCANIVMKRTGIPRPSSRHTVDHKNRSIFDNRRENLRWATPEEQVRNRRLNRNNKSGHQGVTLSQSKDGKYQYWRAYINTTKQKKALSRFFPHTETGLRQACRYYREVLLADESACEACAMEDGVCPHKQIEGKLCELCPAG